MDAQKAVLGQGLLWREPPLGGHVRGDVVGVHRGLGQGVVHHPVQLPGVEQVVVALEHRRDPVLHQHFVDGSMGPPGPHLLKGVLEVGVVPAPLEEVGVV
eukprot:CAMPEP_0113936520 /NCGR_PEP_ID=MMETSP1339-20121228/3423_1 /TAXON_ID=94617 /ORGANISM="Fibrocapsa japonica" /LENGTH=99 /DNA_ID=CAMNT_0000939033 /DNA_START=356 /DNA_END=652 /DNA_ORIENTATION=- /assembly_acc=CAM_ASM_000762